jgi:hypothetical protein
MPLLVDQDRKNTPVTLQSLPGISSVASDARVAPRVAANITGIEPVFYASVTGSKGQGFCAEKLFMAWHGGHP